MTALRHLSWENFQATVFLRGQQRVHRVAEAPSIEIFGDGVTNRIGMWLEVPSDTSVPPELSKLAFIGVRTLDRKGRTLLEVATTASSLHRQFYHFMVAVAERIAVEHRSATDAVRLELQCFTELLEQRPILSIERQLGLIGELIFLERLVTKAGISLLDAWVGPMGEPHDFRLDRREFEVKTTISPRRIHTIHGAEQLVPSKDCSLSLISVLLGPPGAAAGFSLPEMVGALSAQFAHEARRSSQFTSALEACGFRDVDAVHYSRRFAMRRPIAAVRVDAQFPAITRPVIQRALGTVAQRVEGLQYDVNVDGLEHEEGTSKFAAIVAT